MLSIQKNKKKLTLLSCGIVENGNAAVIARDVVYGHRIGACRASRRYCIILGVGFALSTTERFTSTLAPGSPSKWKGDPIIRCCLEDILFAMYCYSSRAFL